MWANYDEDAAWVDQLHTSEPASGRWAGVWGKSIQYHRPEAVEDVAEAAAAVRVDGGGCDGNFDFGEAEEDRADQTQRLDGEN